jgi:hypothetical protein
MSMGRLLAAVAATFVLFQPPAARAAEPWGLEGESVATIRVKVVDLLCAIGGSCPADCGAGRRQMGLLTEDGKLRAAVKGSVDFAGPALDLASYCGRTIWVDGLLVENPKMTLFFVQNLREREDQPWQATEAFATAWSARNGKSDAWMRADPDVKAIIAAEGVFGIQGLKSKSPNVTNPELKAP